ncbi:MAG: GTP-dependent dephospho-CoA kinase family protein [Halobacteriota archaeon]
MDAEDDASAPAVLLRLPEAERGAFKSPLGPVYTEADDLLAAAGRPVIAVGDIVAATLLEAGRTPAVLVVDGRSEREPVDEAVTRTLEAVDGTVRATNPPGTITRSLVGALSTALGADRPMRVVVEGEEDLAVIPAVLLAPDGATVVYGQPGRGMVAVEVTSTTRETVSSLLERLEGDHAAARRLFASG